MIMMLLQNLCVIVWLGLMLGLGFGLGVKCLVLKPKNFLIKVSNKLGKVVPIGDKSGKGGADGAREYIFITNTL